jgi:hypothetical protein
MSRLSKLKEKLFRRHREAPEPVTFRDVPPAPRPPEKEAEIKRATGRLVGELMAVQRKAWEIRHELAGATLKIVSGD